MAPEVRFTSTRLTNMNKRGILSCDQDGYYTLVVGGLNIVNSAGQIYDLKGAEELFQSSSTFMYRVQNGQVKGEMGHPKRQPGMSDDDYIDRILTIEETNVCCHIDDIWLDYNYHKTNADVPPGAVIIMAKVKPAGPMGAVLKESLDNPRENVAFSIRSLTRNFFVAGRMHKVLNIVVTFDCVTSPGIHPATKWTSPGLEDLEDRLLTTSSLTCYVNRQSSFGLESSSLKQEVKQLLFTPVTSKTIYDRW